MFSREDKANRNTYMKAVREEAMLIHDRLTAVQELMKDDNYLDISYSCDKMPVSISEESINQIEDKLTFVLSDVWEKEYNEIYVEVTKSFIILSVVNDDMSLIFSLSCLKEE